MLELKNVSFDYGKRSALANINLSFLSSGVISLVGPNGSGKSTLLKCINRILKPRGEVLFNRRNVQSFSISELSRTFGYVPQEFSSAFPITVFDMILLGRKPYLGWNPSEQDIEVVSENISLMELDDFALRPVNELSGGERQKVLIATALSQEPSVLLLDEPTSNLDIKHQIDVMKHLGEIVRSKKILALMAVHDLNLASHYSEEMVMLRKGKVFAQGKPKEILTKGNIKALYYINVAIHRHGEIKHIVPVEDDDDLFRMEKT
ncbi:MAG TPA: ABC transporter ATP-binding protein [Candidatus Bathyarchaeota archaeon]|nr:ABC transporter ATP-binding protein [Candidatus Bathyarchaeota archaeon]